MAALHVVGCVPAHRGGLGIPRWSQGDSKEIFDLIPNCFSKMVQGVKIEHNVQRATMLFVSV